MKVDIPKDSVLEALCWVENGLQRLTYLNTMGREEGSEVTELDIWIERTMGYANEALRRAGYPEELIGPEKC